MPLLLCPPPSPTSNTFPVQSNIFDAETCVEWSPGVAPGGTPLWVDITQYVRGLEINRGRQRLLEQYETGTCRITLDNRDRRFDPTYTAGPYYGKIVPLARFRVRRQYTTDTCPKFDGYVEGWSQQFDLNGDAVCEVSLADAFKIFALAAPSSPWVGEILACKPSNWYRFSESGGTTVLDALANNNGTFTGAPTYSQNGLVDSDDNTSVGFGAGSYAYADLGSPSTFIGVEGWFQTSASGTWQSIVQFGGPNDSVAMFAVALNSTGQVEFRLWQKRDRSSTTSENIDIFTTLSAYNDGVAHHFSMLIGGAPDNPEWMTFSLDGLRREVNLDTTLRVEAANLQPTKADRLVIGNRYDVSAQFTGNIDEIVVYRDEVVGLEGGSAVSALPPNSVFRDFVARIASHYSFGKTPFNGDDSGTRVGRVLDSINWPKSERVLQSGESTLQSSNYFNASVYDALQDIQRAEQGQLFVDAEGRVRFKHRYALTTGGYRATFGDGFSGESLVLNGTSGQGAKTPHAADMVSSTLNVAVQVELPAWNVVTSAQDFCGKWGLAGQRSWRFSIDTSERLVVQFSSDGTTVTTVTSTSSLTGFTDGLPYWVRFTLAVSGAGYEAYFYYSSNGVSWTQLGLKVSAATPTAIFNASSTALVVGNTVANDQRMIGNIYQLKFGNSTSTAAYSILTADFTQSLNPDVWVATKTGTLFTDATSHIWSTQGSTYWQNAEVPYSEIELSYDDSLVRNVATVQRNGGAEVTSVNWESYEAYLGRNYSQTGLILQFDAQAKDFADSIVQRFGQPAVRAESITVLPEGTPTFTYPRVLPLEIGDFVRVIRRPLGLGSPISANCFVDGVNETIGTQGALNQIQYSLTEASTTQYWIMDDPYYSKLEETTRLGY